MEPPKKVRYLEDLRVFQQARGLVNLVYSLTRVGPISKEYELVKQMRRAAVSVLSNIAEGYERQSNVEFARFLFVAKGSCGELRAQGIVALDQKYWTKDVHDKFTSCCRELSAGLANFIKYLQNSQFRQRKQPLREGENA